MPEQETSSIQFIPPAAEVRRDLAATIQRVGFLRSLLRLAEKVGNKPADSPKGAARAS